MKKHELPEFQVIRQNEANAKFFVASGETKLQTTSSTATRVGESSIDFY